MILENSYFSSGAVTLAPDLLGKIICRRDGGPGGGIIRGRITETECYFGEEDTACHAHRGRTPRTEVLYSSGGVAYVYLCYGMYDLFNIVSGPEGHPEAVLIRGIEGIDGPGRTTRHLGITRAYNRLPLAPESGLWIEDDGFVCDPAAIQALPRVGIDYASEEDRSRLWRFRVRSSRTRG